MNLLLADPRLTTHNHKDNRGWTPVMSAAYYKNAGALRELVAHPSVNLDTKDELGRICKVDLTSDYFLWKGEFIFEFLVLGIAVFMRVRGS